MNKITSTKTTSAIFLATVLIAGTITVIYPSFMIYSAQAQSYYYDGEIDSYDDRNSYGVDNDRKSYDKRSSENDYGYDKSQYQYQSYEPDYKPKYQSYGEKDDRRDKSNKDSKSVSINKFNCINTNININGNNTGDISIGNKGAAEEGYSGAYSSNGSGEGYGKQDKDFDCVINNNNTNTNIVTGSSGGNATEQNTTLAVTKNVFCTPNDTFPQSELTCQTIRNTVLPSSFNITVTGNNPNPSEFAGSNESAVVVNLGAGNYNVTEELPSVVPPIAGVTVTRTTSFAGDCTDVNPNDPTSIQATGTIETGESQTCDITNTYRTSFFSPTGGITASNINTGTSAFDINTAGSLTSLSSPPTIAQETAAADLTAMEKITKLKTQWLNQLP